MAVSTVLPRRIAIFSDGRGSTIATAKPMDLLRATGLTGVEPVAEEVECARFWRYRRGRVAFHRAKCYSKDSGHRIVRTNRLGSFQRRGYSLAACRWDQSFATCNCEHRRVSNSVSPLVFVTQTRVSDQELQPTGPGLSRSCKTRVPNIPHPPAANVESRRSTPIRVTVWALQIAIGVLYATQHLESLAATAAVVFVQRHWSNSS